MNDVPLIVSISSAFPMHSLHFNAAAGPILKPPTSWDPKLSPDTNAKVPANDLGCPFIVNWCPPSLRRKIIEFKN